jgi:hypothetical protein
VSRRVLDRVARALSGFLPTGLIDPFPWILWWIPGAITAATVGEVMWMAESFEAQRMWRPEIQRLYKRQGKAGHGMAL